MIGITQDIIDRKAAEQAIRDSEARYRTLFEQAAVGVMHADLDGRWTMVNRRLAEILGYESPEDLLGRPIWKSPIPTTGPRAKSCARRSTAARSPMRNAKSAICGRTGLASG